MITANLPTRTSHRSWHSRLRSQLAWLGTGAVIMGMSGCMTAQNTRLPSWYTWFPAAENEAYERTDPFPDPDIGPSLDSTPRGYDRPRSESRKAAEQRVFQGIPVGPEYVRPGIPQGGLRTDRAVH
ncbi:MAG: hypothetical protein U0936_25730 [Planctomycetaceae bacterium]